MLNNTSLIHLLENGRKQFSQREEDGSPPKQADIICWLRDNCPSSQNYRLSKRVLDVMAKIIRSQHRRDDLWPVLCDIRERYSDKGFPKYEVFIWEQKDLYEYHSGVSEKFLSSTIKILREDY